MTTTPQPSPDQALFEPDGHLSEIALTSIADGELAELVGDATKAPSMALTHLERCERCSHRLGEAALLSMTATDLVPAGAAFALAPAAEEAPRVPEGQKTRRPVPVAAIAAATVTAVLTAGPSLIDAMRGLHATITEGIAMAPFLGRLMLALVRAPWGQGPVALAAKVVSALVLVMIGLRVARATPRPGSLQEGGVWEECEDGWSDRVLVGSGRLGGGARRGGAGSRRRARGGTTRRGLERRRSGGVARPRQPPSRRGREAPR
jgi:hypothetical protein